MLDDMWCSLLSVCRRGSSLASVLVDQQPASGHDNHHQSPAGRCHHSWTGCAEHSASGQRTDPAAAVQRQLVIEGVDVLLGTAGEVGECGVIVTQEPREVVLDVAVVNPVGRITYIRSQLQCALVDVAQCRRAVRRDVHHELTTRLHHTHAHTHTPVIQASTTSCTQYLALV